MANDKKIIVDEDWKERVQAEKEEAAKSQPTRAAASTSDRSSAHDPGDVSMPPASLELLISSLATETLVALGAIPHPMSGQAEPHPNHARYLIDTIDVLREKTTGNLTPSEQQMFESVLHELRMLFIAVTQSQPAPLEGSPPVDHLA